VSDITHYIAERKAYMNRFALGIIVALAIVLIGGAAHTSAAASAPKPRPGGGIAGQVTSVDSTTITITTPQGNVTIATSSSTTFEVNGATGSLSSVTAGMFVRADGTKAADGTFTG
jgi:RNase P/RNase MRP subunit p29